MSIHCDFQYCSPDEYRLRHFTPAKVEIDEDECETSTSAPFSDYPRPITTNLCFPSAKTMEECHAVKEEARLRDFINFTKLTGCHGTLHALESLKQRNLI